MKVLNLYCGIGGNRKFWKDCDVTAVEYKQDIADVYKKLHPNDTVIVGDAHQYLLDHYKEFDFIWASPPCPSHSKINFSQQREIEYPDMKLYQEIILLQTWFKGKWVVENVIPYYKPLIPAKEIDRHLFWSNFTIPYFKAAKSQTIRENQIPQLQDILGIDLTEFKISNKRQILRNCVLPELGLKIFENARGIYNQNKTEQLKLI